MSADPKAELHVLVDQLGDDEVVEALIYIRSLVRVPAPAPNGDDIYLTLPLTDPSGAAVVTSLRLGPFHSEEEAKLAGDSIVSDITAMYLTTGIHWESCVQQIVQERYAHVLAPDGA